MQFSVEIIDNINKMLIVLDNDDELYVFPLSKAELIFENINENIDVISFDLQNSSKAKETIFALISVLQYTFYNKYNKVIIFEIKNLPNHLSHLKKLLLNSKMFYTEK